MNQNHYIKLLLTLWKQASQMKKKEFLLIILFMVVVNFAELVSIGAVIPFLAILGNPEGFISNTYISKLISNFDFITKDNLPLLITSLFCFLAIFSSFLRLKLLKSVTGFSYSLGADLGVAIYSATLKQSYESYIKKSSSEIIDLISTKSNTVIASIVMPLLTFFSSLIMFLMAGIMLFIYKPLIALSIVLSIFLLYSFVIKISRSRLKKNSILTATESRKLIKILQDGFGGIRDILLDGTADIFIHLYASADVRLRTAQASSVYISQSPRYFIETLGIVLIALLAFIQVGENKFSDLIPIFGLIALGAQKLLPIAQQGYQGYASVHANVDALREVLESLKGGYRKSNDYSLLPPVNFDRKIILRDITYGYKESSKIILNSLNLEINKGDRIGIVGKSGSGKTTLIDIMMGLLKPDSGNLYVDDVPIEVENNFLWQRKIAHVPQYIFLTADSIAENIAFGVPKESIDYSKINQAIKSARLDEYVSSLPNGYHTKIGERGINLSGGQRQRIGIARALYKDADVLIFDEATNALDKKTEIEILDAIYNLESYLTIIIITHNASTLLKCSKILSLPECVIHENKLP